jgi:hypothetical protein
LESPETFKAIKLHNFRKSLSRNVSRRGRNVPVLTKIQNARDRAHYKDGGKFLPKDDLK